MAIQFTFLTPSTPVGSGISMITLTCLDLVRLHLLWCDAENVLGRTNNPNGKQLNAYLPNAVINIVRSGLFSENGICHKSKLVSSSVNTLAPQQVSGLLLGGYASLAAPTYLGESNQCTVISSLGQYDHASTPQAWLRKSPLFPPCISSFSMKHILLICTLLLQCFLYK